LISVIASFLTGIVGSTVMMSRVIISLAIMLNTS
jgi:hypothetical protein